MKLKHSTLDCWSRRLLSALLDVSFCVTAGHIGWSERNGLLVAAECKTLMVWSIGTEILAELDLANTAPIPTLPLASESELNICIGGCHQISN